MSKYKTHDFVNIKSNFMAINQMGNIFYFIDDVIQRNCFGKLRNISHEKLYLTYFFLLL